MWDSQKEKGGYIAQKRSSKTDAKELEKRRIVIVRWGPSSHCTGTNPLTVSGRVEES